MVMPFRNVQNWPSILTRKRLVTFFVHGFRIIKYQIFFHIYIQQKYVLFSFLWLKINSNIWEKYKNGLVFRIYMLLYGPLEQRYFQIYFCLMVHDGYWYFVVAQGKCTSEIFHQNGQK
jgi:hypothetical protein